MATATRNPIGRRSAGNPHRRGCGDERYARLFESLREPAKGMVRRAFGSTFSDDELDDFYASAWLSTLAALERKARALNDDELRRYLMTAVAHQASREMRRRGRKPTISLDSVSSEPTDRTVSPEEAAAQAEDATLTREILGSLPPRRRAVLVFRYGWDLEPKEVCSLVDGLSPRAYRREIERGVAEVAEKMRLVEDGDWCATREPLLRSFVAGVGSDEETRQARQHLANCRSCASFVSRLNDHLHDLGGGVALAAVADASVFDAGSILERGLLLLDRAKHGVGSVFSRGSEATEHLVGQVASSGGAQGAGVAGAGAVAKLAGAGALPKLVAACLGTGVAATACVAAGIVPGLEEGRGPARSAAKEVARAEGNAREIGRHARLSVVDAVAAPVSEPGPTPTPDPPAEPAPPTPGPPPVPNPESAPPTQTPSQTVQEFEPVGVPVEDPGSATVSSDGSSGSKSSGTDAGEFGP